MTNILFCLFIKFHVITNLTLLLIINKLGHITDNYYCHTSANPLPSNNQVTQSKTTRLSPSFYQSSAKPLRYSMGTPKPRIQVEQNLLNKNFSKKVVPNKFLSRKMFVNLFSLNTRYSPDLEAATMYKLKGQSSNMQTGQSFKY